MKLLQKVRYYVFKHSVVPEKLSQITLQPVQFFSNFDQKTWVQVVKYKLQWHEHIRRHRIWRSDDSWKRYCSRHPLVMTRHECQHLYCNCEINFVQCPCSIFCDSVTLIYAGIIIKKIIIDWKSAISLKRGPVDPKFQVKGVASTNRSSSEKTRLSDLSYGIKIWTAVSSVLSYNPRVWQTNRRTDRQLSRV